MKYKNFIFIINLLLLVLSLISCAPADSELQKAENLLNQGSYREAFQAFLLLAGKGNPEAQFYIGQMKYDGIGVEQDREKALYWYEKASRQGHADAQINVSTFYYTGEVVEQDYATAFKYLKMAADNNSTVALARIGTMYHDGKGVAQDFEKAIHYFQKAFGGKGHTPEELYAYGIMHAKGFGVPKDKKIAHQFFVRAAKEGDVDAQLVLGMFHYSEGNEETAKKWFDKARGQGVSEDRIDLIVNRLLTKRKKNRKDE